MSEISEQEAREAAESMQFLKDMHPSCELNILAKWAVEDLDRRDAAKAARQQPITHEWCEANGAELSCEWYWFDDGVSIRPIAGGKWLVVVNSRMLDWSAECVGQVEDLRKALRGGA